MPSISKTSDGTCLEVRLSLMPSVCSPLTIHCSLYVVCVRELLDLSGDLTYHFRGLFLFLSACLRHSWPACCILKHRMLTIVLFKVFSRCFFPNKKNNYHAQNVEIWRRRRKSTFVGKCKQNQCYNELLNTYQPAMTCRMDHNHTDKYQVCLCLYFQTQVH